MSIRFSASRALGPRVRPLISAHILKATMQAVQPVCIAATALTMAQAIATPAYATTEVARFEASASSTEPQFPGFGNQEFKAGQKVTITVAGDPGARVRFFVGPETLYDNTIPSSGMLMAMFVLREDISGETSIGIENVSENVTTTVTVVVTEEDEANDGGDTGDDQGDDAGADDDDTGADESEDDDTGDEDDDDTGAEDDADEDDAAEEEEEDEVEEDAPQLPEVTANGQAASDQIRALIETIVPGLSNDLGDAFFIPDPFGGETGTPTGIAQNPAGVNIPAALPPVQIVEQDNDRDDRADEEAVTANNGQCKEDEIQELRAQLQRAQERFNRIDAQFNAVISVDFAGSPDDAIQAAEQLIEASENGPIALDLLDVLALKNVLNKLNAVDPEARKAFQAAKEEDEAARRDFKEKDTEAALSRRILRDHERELNSNPTEDRAQLLREQIVLVREGLPAEEAAAEAAEQRLSDAFDAFEQISEETGLGDEGSIVREASRNAIVQLAKAREEAELLIANIEGEISFLLIDCDEDQQVRRTTPVSPQQSPIQFAARSRGTSDHLSFTISTRNMDTALDPSVTVFFGADVTFHNDGRTGVGQDGETFAMAGGVSWQVGADTTIGLAGRYARTDVSGLSGSTVADTSSIAAFVQGRLTDKLFYEVVGAYTISDMDAVFIQPGITTTGRPDVDSFALQGSLSGQVKRGDVTIRPSVGLSYVHVDQAAFLLSDGTAAPDQTTDRVSLRAGAQFSKQIRNEARGQTFSPYAGLTAIAHLSDTKSFLLPNGTFSDAGTFGASANFGVSVATDRGIRYSFGSSVSAFEQGNTSYGLNMNLTIPFN